MLEELVVEALDDDLIEDEYKRKFNNVITSRGS